MQPDIALALEDFLPVLLIGLALYWLSRTITYWAPANRTSAYLGSILVIAGGLFKAGEKLIGSITGESVVWMSSALFILMAPGFYLLALSVWTLQSRPAPSVQSQGTWLAPGAVVGLTLGGTTLAQSSDLRQPWFLILLGIVVVGSSLLSIILSRLASQLGQRWLSAAFIGYLVSILVLNGLARVPSETNAAEWTKQLINSGAAALFVYSCWQLYTHIRKARRIGRT